MLSLVTDPYESTSKLPASTSNANKARRRSPQEPRNVIANRNWKLTLVPDTVKVDGSQLTITDLVQVAHQYASVTITPEAGARIQKSHDVLEKVSQSTPIYGMNTQLGPYCKQRVSAEEIDAFQTDMVIGHAFMCGERLNTATVRAMMLARVNGFAKGTSGVRLEIVSTLIAMLNEQIHPVVYAGTSVGQSDLSEMAQIASALIGHGQVEYMGTARPALEAFSMAGLSPCKLIGKEALSLISFNGLTIGQGCLVWTRLQQAWRLFNGAAALSLEAYGGNLSTLRMPASKVKAHPGFVTTSSTMRALLSGSSQWDVENARNLQDPLSFRCAPLVHGALLEESESLLKSLEIELNSSGDNPLVSIEDEQVFSVGNFDVTNLSIRFDAARIALAHTIDASNERIQKLLWQDFSGLPTGLESTGDKTSRMVQLGRAAAAWTAEARTLAYPVSLSYRGQIGQGIEDTASMAPLSVKQTENMLSIAKKIAAAEMLIAYNAAELRGLQRLGSGTGKIAEFIRQNGPLNSSNWHKHIELLLKEFESVLSLRFD